MVAISKKYVTIGVAIAAVAAVAIALVNSKKKKIAYSALALPSAVEGLTPRIIGGDTLDQDVWYANRRYLVKIIGSGLCGATLVSRRVILTAAHCFTVLPDDPMPPNVGAFAPQVLVEFNSYTFAPEGEGTSSIYLCESENNNCVDTSLAYVIRHPEYNFTTNANDLTLIILPEEQQITNISPVKLNPDPNVPEDGQELEAFGWGTISCAPNELSPNEIQTGTLEYVNNTECAYGWATNITDDKLCARTDSTNGVAVGKGDSGGPLVILDEFGGSLQVGVVSYGATGTDSGTNTFPEQPDVFARISFLYDWIQDTVCAEVPGDEVFCLASTPSSPTTAKSSKSSKSPTSKPSVSFQPTASPSKAGKLRKLILSE